MDKQYALGYFIPSKHNFQYVYMFEDGEIIRSQTLAPEEVQTYVNCLEDLGYTRTYFASEYDSVLAKATEALQQAEEICAAIRTVDILDEKYDKLYR